MNTYYRISWKKGDQKKDDLSASYLTLEAAEKAFEAFVEVLLPDEEYWITQYVTEVIETKVKKLVNPKKPSVLVKEEKVEKKTPFGVVLTRMERDIVAFNYKKPIDQISAPVGYKFNGAIKVPEPGEVYMDIGECAMKATHTTTQTITNYRLILVEDTEKKYGPLYRYLTNACDVDADNVFVHGIVPKAVWIKEGGK